MSGGPAGPARPGSTGMFRGMVHGPSSLVRAACAVLALGVLGGGVVAWQRTAASSAGTSNGPNSWLLGSVSLDDDTSGAALFQATDLVPGSTGSNCVSVDYTGNRATAVKLYAGAANDPAGLAPYLNLTIEQGAGGGYGSCAGFTPDSTIYSGTLAQFTARDTDFASGVGTWAPSGSAREVYRFSYALDPATPDRQLALTRATFEWEAQF